MDSKTAMTLEILTILKSLTPDCLEEAALQYRWFASDKSDTVKRYVDLILKIAKGGR